MLRFLRSIYGKKKTYNPPTKKIKKEGCRKKKDLIKYKKVRRMLLTGSACLAVAMIPRQEEASIFFVSDVIT